MGQAKKVSIGFVVNNLVVGGVSNVLINLCNQFNVERYSVHLIVLSQNTPMEDIIPLEKHVNKVTFDYEFSDDYSLLAYLKNSFDYSNTEKRASQLIETIMQLELDILHFHTLPRQLVIGILAKRKQPQLQLVYTDHTYRIDKTEYNWYQLFFLKLAYQRLYREYHLVSVSPTVSEYISNFGLHSKSKKFETLSNTINISNYSRKTPIKSINQAVIIYVSRVCEQKGIETLIEAWQQLQHKGRLMIVGPDESNGRYQAMSKGLQNIEFKGSTDDVTQYLDLANIGVFPSEKEGLPLSLLEKMAFELPIVISNIPELVSILSDREEGLHFKKNDANDLVQQLMKLMDDETLRHRLGQAARKKVELMCEQNHPIRFHEQFYNELLSL